MTMPTPLHSQTARNPSQRRCAAGLKCIALLAVAAGGLIVSPALGAIKPSGSVSVAANPDSSTLVGLSGFGMLTIDGGSDLLNRDGVVGYFDIGFGIVTVDGPGSTWVNSQSFYVGAIGDADVTISNGGLVSSLMDTRIGNSPSAQGFLTVTGAGSKLVSTGQFYVGYEGTGSLYVEAGGQVLNELGGTIAFRSGLDCDATVTGAGSQWTIKKELLVGRYSHGSLTVSDGGKVSAETIYASLADLKGNGTIQVNGAVLDGGLVFDSSHGLDQTLLFGSGGQLNLACDGTGVVGAGHRGTGTLRIAEGSVVTGSAGVLGFTKNSAGVATVTGLGSTWISTGELTVGQSGRGSLLIENGGRVTSSRGEISDIGNRNASAVTVTGPGSEWAIRDALSVGYADYGSAKLNLNNGGKVSARDMSVAPAGTLRLHVSNDGMLVLGNASKSGVLFSQGQVDFLADAFLPAGTYRPITEFANRTLTYNNQGTIQTTGGTWNPAALTFTVAAPTYASAGTLDTLTTNERLIFSSNNKQLGVAVGSVTNAPTLSALPLPGSDLDALLAQLAPDASIAGAWRFTGTFAGPGLLSIPTGLDAQDVQVWRLHNGAWSLFSPDLFTYDANGITSFSITSWDAYAVSAITAAPVPLPGALPAALSLLSAGGVATLVRQRRTRRSTRTN